MKVLQVVDTLKVGGTERMCVNIANLLAVEGHRSVVFATRSSGPLRDQLRSDVKLIIGGKRSSLDLRAFRKFLKIIREEKPDIVHAHSSSVYWSFAAKILRVNFKLIWHDHFGESELLKPGSRPLIRWLGGSIDGIIVVNSRLLAWNKKVFKPQNTPVVLIHNFATLSALQPDIKRGNIVLKLANFRPQKDHHTLIRAVKILVDQKIFEGWKCKLVGHYEEDRYFQSVKKMIEDFRLEDYLIVSGPEEEIEKEIAMASIGVLSSRSEGLPLTLLEYGLSGLAVLATDVGECSEVIGGKGILVKPGNPEEMAAALAKLIQNPKRRESMGKEFCARVNENYGSAGFLKQYIQLTRGIIDS